MRKFLRRGLIFFLPPLILIITVFWLDLFKILGFQDYYSNQTISLNREMITTTTYNHFKEKEQFNSFIFGSSRSLAFKCKNWVTHLDNKPTPKPFHFDASGEGIWGISKKISYIDKVGGKIKNALIILDRRGLKISYPRQGHLFVSMPCVSNSSNFVYYAEFIKVFLNPKFLTGYLDYSIFNVHRDYMGPMFRRSRFNDIANKTNCDIWFGWDKEIKNDSLSFYNKQINKGVFYERPKPKILRYEITPEGIDQLNNIKSILNKHNTKYKIVISPLYEQINIRENHLKLLEKIFGQENIYNFSGKNKFTEPIQNFYEDSHYRPHVADEIMNQIYSTTN